MNNHVSDDLPRLLTGDADRDVVLAAAEHLRTCPDCQQDLVSAVVAHAALTSAHRFAPEIVAHDTEDLTSAADDEPPLPDLSSMFARVHDEARDDAAPAARHNRRRLVAVAAAAAVIVGGGSTIAALELGGSASDARSVALSAYPEGTSSARANVQIQDSKLKVDATALPKLDAQHVYELWVTDRDRKNMSPVGTFGNGRAELTVARNVLAQYNDFEVSVQPSNEIKDYSGHSVVRGEYG
ncbi:anti-sigma factor domain-containing protein [uncultured Jatrophihabitans sp.]|uniref:anti-sigma factor domain-containing protein n=1 Tax=uncultured Jatrophihabitans sp. TaxID=1610747 RepID=UPI0035CCA3C5